MAFLIAVSVFFVVTLVVVSAFTFLREREQQTAITEKIMEFSGMSGDEVAQEDMLLPKQQVAKQFAQIVRYFGNLLKPQKKEKISLIQKRFQSAGLRKRNVLVPFFGLKAVCAICLSMGFVAVFALFQLKFPVPIAIALVILLSFFGFYLPNLWLSLKTSHRQDEILEGFPDAIDLLAVCVEAGMGLDGAIKRVGEEMRFSNKALSDEFGLLNLEIRAGKGRKEAMRSMADRINLEEINTWVSLIIQTDRLGTSISQSIRVQSDSLRTKRAQRLEEMAAKIPTKLLFPTIFCIFPSLFLVILGPAIIRIFKVLS